MSCHESDDFLNEINISDAHAKIPRRVRLDRVSLKVGSGLLLVVMMGLFCNAWIIYGNIKDSHLRDMLHREGNVVIGEVTRASITRDGVNVRYVFSIDGVSYSGRAEMRTDHYTVPGVGGQISIRYLPNDPRVSQPVDWEWFSPWDIVPFLFVWFIMVISALPIIVTMRERTLARLGVVIEGKVTGCAHDRKPMKVYYEFNTEDRTLIEGSSDVSEEYEVGTPIPIIYLQRNPKRNGRYPLGDFHIAE